MYIGITRDEADISGIGSTFELDPDSVFGVGYQQQHCVRAGVLVRHNATREQWVITQEANVSIATDRVDGSC